MPMSAHKMAEGGVEKGRKKEALRAIEWGRETKSWRGGKNGIAEGREGPTDPIEFNEGKSLSCVSKLVSMAPSTTTSPSDASQNISLAIRIKLESNNFRIWLNQAPETNRSLAMMHVLSALIIYIPPRVFSNCFQKIESWLLQTLNSSLSHWKEKKTKKI
ncbi:hypothetical protein TB2_034874 [Malus domestica]